jgi:D-3-phosphoglycerate dehydrogenase
MAHRVVGYYTNKNFDPAQLANPALDGIFPAERLLAKDEAAFRTFSGRIDGLIFSNNAGDLNASVLAELAPRCRIIVRQGIGVDNIDLDAAARLGIAVANTPEYCIEEVSDHALALILALNRHIPAYDGAVKGGVWNALSLSPPGIVRNLTLGIVGFGRIGSCLARKAVPLFGGVAAYDIRMDTQKAAHLGVAVAGSLESLVRGSDVVSLHIPGTRENHRIINADTLAWFKPGSLLINTARGVLVDEEALLQALSRKAPAAAGLDVLAQEYPPREHPLLNTAGVVLTPHAAYYSGTSSELSHKMAHEEMARGLAGKPLKHPVNAPDGPGGTDA